MKEILKDAWELIGLTKQSNEDLIVVMKKKVYAFLIQKIYIIFPDS